MPSTLAELHFTSFYTIRESNNWW